VRNLNTSPVLEDTLQNYVALALVSFVIYSNFMLDSKANQINPLESSNESPVSVKGLFVNCDPGASDQIPNLEIRSLATLVQMKLAEKK
jgi:hypothetical protein